MKQVKHTFMTEENIKEIALQFRDGKNPKEIAEMINLNVVQVMNCIRKLRNLGVELPSTRASSSVYNKVANELKG